MTPAVRTEYVNMIERSMMELNDDYMGFKVSYEDGFFIKRQANRLQWNERFQTSIAFEVSRDQKFYYRVVYSALDFLAETGGLFSMLSRFCILLIAIVNDYASF